jgi:hypothetical protein
MEDCCGSPLYRGGMMGCCCCCCCCSCRSGIILTRSNIFALSANCSVLSLEQNVTHNIHLCCDFYINSSRNNSHFQNLWLNPNEKAQKEGDYLTIELLFVGENALGYEYVLRLGVPSFWRPKFSVYFPLFNLFGTQVSHLNFSTPYM